MAERLARGVPNFGFDSPGRHIRAARTAGRSTTARSRPLNPIARRLVRRDGEPADRIQEAREPTRLPIVQPTDVLSPRGQRLAVGEQPLERPPLALATLDFYLKAGGQ